METTTPYRAVVMSFLSAITPLAAQNLAESARVNDIRPLAASDLEGRDFKRFEAAALPGTYEVPDTKATALLPSESDLFVSQDPATLGDRRSKELDSETVVDLAPLREPSPFRKMAVAAGISAAEAAAKNLPMGLALLAATYRAPGESVKESDCPALGLSVQQRVKRDPSAILEIVESEITANGSCACEVVKAALTAVDADADLTASVVEAAATAAPESMRLISQCAIATVPDALSAVQAVLAKLDPNSGDGGDSAKSAKSSKSAKSAKSSKSGKEPIAPPKPDIGNPLDLPPLGPPLPPPPFNPPPVTEVESTKVHDCRFD